VVNKAERERQRRVEKKTDPLDRQSAGHKTARATTPSAPPEWPQKRRRHLTLEPPRARDIEKANKRKEAGERKMQQSADRSLAQTCASPFLSLTLFSSTALEAETALR